MFAVVLWIYVALLIVGGTVGFSKAGSLVSLVTAVVFSAVLGLCAAGIIRSPYVAELLVGALLLLFATRFARGKKFMPSGLMAILSVISFVLLLIARD